jgi:acid phosphatase (class A)
MKIARFSAVAALVAMAVSLAVTQSAAQKAAPARRSGYLTGTAIPDMNRVLPTAPATDSARDKADRAIFLATRSLQDSPRWKLAQSDNDMSVAGILAAFQCALGVTLNRGNAPHTTALFDRVAVDANVLTGPPKMHFHRNRPFLQDEGPVCVARPDTPDFPSGHSTLGWAAGLIFTELLPDRATEVMTRGRSFGESRVVCGVHNASAVEGGRVVGAALVAALQSSKNFRADLEAARSEIAGLRGNPPVASPACAAEAALIAVSPY